MNKTPVNKNDNSNVNNADTSLNIKTNKKLNSESAKKTAGENVDTNEDRFARAVRIANSKRRKKRKKTALTAIIAIFCIAVALLLVFTVVFHMESLFSSLDNGEVGNKNDNDGENFSSEINEEVYKTPMLDNLFEEPVYDFENEEMRGVWIASVININYPSKPGLSEGELKAELDVIVNNALDAGLNTVFFQVRPTADALYPSEYFPYSKYVSGKQGIAPDNNFDSLAYLLEKAAENNLAVHAWVNPFRVTMYESDEAELSSDNPAVVNPEYTVKFADGKTYFNPGIPEVRTLIINGVRELAANYPGLAGIHFDDYFYPYPSGDAEFDDEAQFALYGGDMTKEDWRRSNVNTLIHDTYYAVKEVNENIRFGVSPFGIWANSGSDTPVDGSVSSGLEAYNTLYCDALAWANGGYVDYLIPQIYWSFSTNAAPFDNIARWWNRELDGTGVDFYIGHAAYKVSDYDENEIGIQVEFARSLLSYRGSVYYGYEDIANNTRGLKEKIAELNRYPVRYAENPDNNVKAKIFSPGNNAVVSSSTVTLSGKSDPRYPLTVNGKKVSRTKNGYFSLYETVSAGSNTFVLNQNGVTSSHNINYKTKGTASVPAEPETLDGFVIKDVSPSFDAYCMTGDEIVISCTAPSGCDVLAQIGDITVELSPTVKPSGNKKYLKEVYRGVVTPEAIAAEDGIATLGTLVITATRGAETLTVSGGLFKQYGVNAPVYAEVVKDYSHLKVSANSSFYDDYTPASVGMRDYIRGISGSYYKLSFGGYISVDDIKIVEGLPLSDNAIKAVRAFVNGKDTVNNKNNFTDVVFECNENVPADAVASSGRIDVVFYNTDITKAPEAEIEANPLFKVITSASDEEKGTLTYTVHLKDELNCYGYNIIYEDGKIILRMKNPQTMSHEEGKPLTGKTIVVDAGHGGTDRGASGCGLVDESELNLAISIHLRDELERLGATVLMTRTDYDQTVSLYERMDFLTETDPDLAISVHQNSIAESSNAQKIRGYLGLYGTEAGRLAAKNVSSRVSYELNRYERPYAYQMLAVARNHRFPSTLCEMCFVSNTEEYDSSVTEGNAKRSAQALAKGILDYYVAQEAYLEY